MLAWTMRGQAWPRSSFFGFFASALFYNRGICRCHGGEAARLVGKIIVHRNNDDFSYCTYSVKPAKEINDRSEPMDERTRTEIEAAVFRRRVNHLRERTDVQNIDMMILAGFCRNCLGDWFREAAAERRIALGKEEAREVVYGMSPEEWKKRYQKEATAEQIAAFANAQKSS